MFSSLTNLTETKLVWTVFKVENKIECALLCANFDFV